MNRVLDVDDGPGQDGLRIQLYDHDPNRESNQAWLIQKQSDGTYVIRNRASGKVLGVDGDPNGDGAPIKQQEDKGTPNHKWMIRHVNPADPASPFIITSVQSNKVLDADASEGGANPLHNGVKVQQWYWRNGAPNQEWFIEAIK